MSYKEESQRTARTAIICATVFFVALIGSCQATNHYISEAIASGAEPMAAHCAIAGVPNTQSCDVIVAYGERK